MTTLTPVRARAAVAVATSLVVLAASLAAAAPAPLSRVQQAAADPGREVSAAAKLAALMTIPSTDTGVVPAPDVPGDDRARACPASRCRDHRIPVPAGVKVTGSTVRVLVPPGYATSRKRYPVVYLFNGAKSTYDRWTRNTAITALSSRTEAIFVSPEGGHGTNAGYFTDWHDGTWDWETFHTQVLLPWVDRNYRTLPGARAAVGASMGSIGALGYAARHPGLFKAVASFSGSVDTNQLASNSLPAETAGQLGLDPTDLSRVWGNPVLHHLNWEAHNPTALAPRLKGVKLFITSGTGFAGTGTGVYSGGVESLIWNQHRTFLTALTAAGVPYEARVTQGGVHNWPWFDEPLRWALPQLVAAARA